MDSWNEIRTAYQVARLGTISAASEVLGVHRATVTRHIDALEEELGGKLFQRHHRGYTLTEVGEDLLRVASTVEEQLDQWVGRTKGRSAVVSGELVVTSVGIVSSLVVRMLGRFREYYPKVTIRFLVSEKLLNLEYGEAHIAIRSGAKPKHPDVIVRPFMTLQSGMYAHRDYVKQHGVPTSTEEFAQHWFIGSERETTVPIFQWMNAHVPDHRVVFRSADDQSKFLAMLAGYGIAFYPVHLALERDDLVEVVAPKPEWDMSFWLITHVDLHRTVKVQAFLKVLKESFG